MPPSPCCLCSLCGSFPPVPLASLRPLHLHVVVAVVLVPWHGGGSLLSPPPPASCRCCRPILVLVPVVILSSGSLSSFRRRSLTLVSRWPHCSRPSLSPLSCCPLVHHSSHLILCWPRHSCPVGPRFHPASSCSRRRSVVVLVVLVALVTLVVPLFLRSSSLSQFWLLVMGGHRWWGR
jgi:hypothetical protein